MVTIRWQGGMVFEAEPPSGLRFKLDTKYDDRVGEGPTPIETFLTAIAACTAMDVVSILEKQRQNVTAYRVEIDGNRPSVGEYPRAFSAIRLRHVVEGENLDPAAVQRAVDLSDNKYCSVIATLRQGPEISSVWEIAAPSSR